MQQPYRITSNRTDESLPHLCMDGPSAPKSFHTLRESSIMHKNPVVSPIYTAFPTIKTPSPSPSLHRTHRLFRRLPQLLLQLDPTSSSRRTQIPLLPSPTTTPRHHRLPRRPVVARRTPRPASSLPDLLQCFVAGDGPVGAHWYRR